MNCEPDNTPEPRRWPLHEVESIAIELRDWLAPFCLPAEGSAQTGARIEIAGSIRRRKPMVGDIELVYVPRHLLRRIVGEGLQVLARGLGRQSLRRTRRQRDEPAQDQAGAQDRF